MTGDYDKRRLIEWLRAETARATGHRYQIDFDALDVQSLRELVRLIRDLDHEKQAAVNRARMRPWRRQAGLGPEVVPRIELSTTTAYSS